MSTYNSPIRCISRVAIFTAACSKLRILDFFEALLRPLELRRRLIIHPLRMLMYVQLIKVLTFLPSLHHILSQNLRHALGMFKGLPGFDAAAFE